MTLRPWLAVLLVCTACHGCNKSGGSASLAAPPGVTPSTLTITSRSFPSGGTIPIDFTCDGADRSPQLTWSAPPRGTQSFAIIASDPDAQSGDFTHWVAFNLPGDTLSLPESADLAAIGAAAGLNDFKQAAYGGPCPPKYEIHHYAFRVFALDTRIDVPPGSSRESVESAMNGHVLGHGTLVGTFSH
jgi:Raf kinase inhibitor-like YbhB/YbcL family protein